MKLELRHQVGDGELKFEAQWTGAGAVTVKRSGPKEFELPLDEFSLMVNLTKEFVETIRRLREAK